MVGELALHSPIDAGVDAAAMVTFRNDVGEILDSPKTEASFDKSYLGTR